jgi:hypothetical protein
MKLEELLKNVKKLVFSWGIFLSLASLLSYAIFTGVVFQKAAVAADLDQYVEYFKTKAAKYKVKVDLSNIRVVFVERMPVKGWVGLCETLTTGTKVLSIHRGYFERMPEEVRYSLILHELGHCALGREHSDAMLPGGCPVSVMHWKDNMKGCFYNNQMYYLKELFGIPQ